MDPEPHLLVWCRNCLETSDQLAADVAAGRKIRCPYCGHEATPGMGDRIEAAIKLRLAKLRRGK